MEPELRSLEEEKTKKKKRPSKKKKLEEEKVSYLTRVKKLSAPDLLGKIAVYFDYMMSFVLP